MQWHRQTRPTTLPVSTEALHDGLNLIADQDVELTRDAERKALAATYEFEDHGEVALINQVISVTFTAPHPLLSNVTIGAGWSLPIWPVAPEPNLTVSVVRQSGEAHVVPSDHVTMRPGRRPLLTIMDHGALPPAMREVYSRLRVEYQAGFGPDHASIPADIAQAIISQAALMQDAGWDLRRGHSGLSPHTARIAARYRGVAI